MKTILICCLWSIMFFMVACSSETDIKNAELLTERIQYDVDIKSPHVELDWWVQNIEGAKRENLINLILDKVYAGEVVAFNYWGDIIPPDDVKAIGYRNDTLIMPSSFPPYEDSLVVINERLKKHDITRLRFMEEWYIEPRSLLISKKVLGMALLMSDYDADGEFRGYRLLFWMYFDKRYPLKNAI